MARDFQDREYSLRTLCLCKFRKQARFVMSRRIARRDGVPFGAVLSAADTEIKKEIEFQEEEA